MKISGYSNHQWWRTAWDQRRPLIFCLLVHINFTMVCALVTHQIWTNGYRAHNRLRAYARWLHTCILQVMCIEPSAGCLSCEHSFQPLVYKPTSWWSWSKRRSQSLGGGSFFEQCAKKSFRDDYVRPFGQLVVRKCLDFVFLHSHLKGLF